MSIVFFKHVRILGLGVTVFEYTALKKLTKVKYSQKMGDARIHVNKTREHT